MRRDLNRLFLWFLGFALFLPLALGTGPSSALAQGKPAPGPDRAFLYEMSENAALYGVTLACALAGVGCTPPVLLVPDSTGQSPTQLVIAGTSTPGFPTNRRAVSELQGVATLDTPLCPKAFLITFPKLKECVVTVTGTDDVALVMDPTTGQVVPTSGRVEGAYAVLIQLDNSVDSPEWPLQTGTFSGTIHFQLPLPLGFVPDGTVTIDGVNNPDGSPVLFQFKGTFRMPFAKNEKGEHKKARRGHDAFYLLDNGKLQRVRQDERAVGWPTVRFEINFNK